MASSPSPRTKRIGVAISDELKMIAQPLEFILAEPFATFSRDSKKSFDPKKSK